FLIRAFPILAGAVIVAWVWILVRSAGLPDWARARYYANIALFIPHSLVGCYFEQTSRKLADCFDLEWFEADKLPDWVRAQAEKNDKKRSAFALASVLVILLLFCPLEGWEVGFIGFAALNLAFQSGMY